MIWGSAGAAGSGVVEQVGVQPAGERVGGGDVEPAVLHERRDVGHRSE
jgi:hypothetical protein